MVEVSETIVKTTSKEKQPNLLKDPPTNTIVSSDHNKLPPGKHSVNPIIEMKLQQAAVNETADSALMEKVKERTIVYGNEDGNVNANRAAGAEKTNDTDEAQKLAEVGKVNVAKIPLKPKPASVVEVAETASMTEKDMAAL